MVDKIKSRGEEWEATGERTSEAGFWFRGRKEIGLQLHMLGTDDLYICFL